MKIIFECDITDWATPEEFAGMTHDEIKELVHEDLTAALDSAIVRVIEDLDVIKARAEKLYADRAGKP